MMNGSMELLLFCFLGLSTTDTYIYTPMTDYLTAYHLFTSILTMSHLPTYNR